MSDNDGVVFQLPRGVTGFGRDFPLAELAAQRAAFITWAQSVAGALETSIVVLDAGEPAPSFDVVRLERVGLWLLHNRYIPLVGVTDAEPVPGHSWAVAGEYVDLAVADHLVSWGPQVLAAETLNASVSDSLDGLGLGAREQADRYKPQTVGNVIFNYWQ